MNQTNWQQHAIDFLKGLLAVMAVNACLAALNYIGAHIPAAISVLTQLAAATAGVKAHNA